MRRLTEKWLVEVVEFVKVLGMEKDSVHLRFRMNID